MAVARQACTRANRMAIRVGLMNKPAAHRQVINILQRLARQSDGSIVDMTREGQPNNAHHEDRTGAKNSCGTFVEEDKEWGPRD